MSMFKLGDLSFNREIDMESLVDFEFDDKDQEILDFMDALLPNVPHEPEKRKIKQQVTVTPYEGSLKFLTDYRSSNLPHYKKLCLTVAQRGWISIKKFETKNWTNQNSYIVQKEFLTRFNEKCIKGTRDNRIFQEDIITHASYSTVKQLMSNDIYRASLELRDRESKRDRPFVSYIDNILLKAHTVKHDEAVQVGMNRNTGDPSYFKFKRLEKRPDSVSGQFNRNEELGFLKLMNKLGVTYHGSFYGMKDISKYRQELTVIFNKIITDDTLYNDKTVYKDCGAINYDAEQENYYDSMEYYTLEDHVDDDVSWNAFKFEKLILSLLKTNYMEESDLFVKMWPNAAYGKTMIGSIEEEEIFTYYLDTNQVELKDTILLYLYKFLSTLMLVYAQDNLNKFEKAKTNEEIQKLVFSYKDVLNKLLHEGEIGDYKEEARTRRLERAGPKRAARSSTETMEQMRNRFEQRHATLVHLIKQKEKARKDPFCLD